MGSRLKNNQVKCVELVPKKSNSTTSAPAFAAGLERIGKPVRQHALVIDLYTASTGVHIYFLTLYRIQRYQDKPYNCLL